MGDPGQIHQIIMNLCTNAAQAMQEMGGILEVNLEEVAVDFNQFEEQRNLISGSYMRLTVSDTGQGIAPEIFERIFDPYFTTKEMGEGTGLGLAVVHGIVKSHGGEITVDSQLEKGTTFQVYLPIIAKKVSVEEDDLKELPAGQGCILYVDDENALVQTTRQMLEGIGYEVETRTSSVEALELFRAYHRRFDLVITDMTMPNMTGIQLAQEFARIRPGIPIILCTGYSEQVNIEAASNAGVTDLLVKPFSTQDIALSVKKALAASNN